MEMELIVKKYNLDVNGDANDKPLAIRYQHSIQQLEKEIRDLDAEMEMVSMQNS